MRWAEGLQAWDPGTPMSDTTFVRLVTALNDVSAQRDDTRRACEEAVHRYLRRPRATTSDIVTEHLAARAEQMGLSE